MKRAAYLLVLIAMCCALWLAYAAEQPGQQALYVEHAK